MPVVFAVDKVFNHSFNLVVTNVSERKLFHVNHTYHVDMLHLCIVPTSSNHLNA